MKKNDSSSPHVPKRMDEDARAAAARRREARRVRREGSPAPNPVEDAALAARERCLVDYASLSGGPSGYVAGALPLIFSVADDVQLLPHFVRHYERQGATDFLCVAWDDAPSAEVESLLPGDRSLVVRPGGPFSLGFADSHLQNQIRLAHLAPGSWYLVADLDEFHEVPGFRTLASAVAAAARDGAEVIAGEFVDRLARDGSLPARIPPAANLGRMFPLRTRATRRLKTAATEKVVAASSHIAIHRGHHRHEGREWIARGEVHHYAWRGDLRERMARRLERVRELGETWGGECQRLIEALDENGGRLPLTLPPERPVPPRWRTQ